MHLRAAGAAALTSLKGLVEEQNQEVSKCSMRIGELVGSSTTFLYSTEGYAICKDAIVLHTAILQRHLSMPLPGPVTQFQDHSVASHVSVSHNTSLTNCLLC